MFYGRLAKKGMKMAALIFIFFLFLAANIFAQEKETQKSDTVSGKVTGYSRQGYKTGVKPDKKTGFFQLMYDWADRMTSPASRKLSLVMKKS